MPARTHMSAVVTIWSRWLYHFLPVCSKQEGVAPVLVTQLQQRLADIYQDMLVVWREEVGGVKCSHSTLIMSRRRQRKAVRGPCPDTARTSPQCRFGGCLDRSMTLCVMTPCEKGLGLRMMGTDPYWQTQVRADMRTPVSTSTGNGIRQEAKLAQGDRQLHAIPHLFFASLGTTPRKERSAHQQQYDFNRGCSSRKAPAQRASAHPPCARRCTRPSPALPLRCLSRGPALECLGRHRKCRVMQQGGRGSHRSALSAECARNGAGLALMMPFSVLGPPNVSPSALDPPPSRHALWAHFGGSF